MDACKQHPGHAHNHADGCGHDAVRHDGHLDYLHDGHLHHPHSSHVDDHVLAVGKANPEFCSAGHPCNVHTVDHKHGTGCGHAAVPHGRHVDHLVDGHLHSSHAGHCDNHGVVLR